MNQVRKQKLFTIFIVLTIISISVLLVAYALRQNISLFYSPAEVNSGKAPVGKKIRIGGMVVDNSLIKSDNLAVDFKITDYSSEVEVHYQGILPDLFREGQGVVTEGKLVNNKFMATEVLAKHDENYMPPQVKEVLKK